MRKEAGAAGGVGEEAGAAEGKEAMGQNFQMRKLTFEGDNSQSLAMGMVYDDAENDDVKKYLDTENGVSVNKRVEVGNDFDDQKTMSLLSQSDFFDGYSQKGKDNPKSVLKAVQTAQFGINSISPELLLSSGAEK